MEGILQTKNYKDFEVVLDDKNAHFEGAKLANRALPGDKVNVLFEPFQIRLVERTTHKLIVGTLEVSSKTLYGMTSRGVPIYRFTPFSPAYPPFFVGSSQKDTRHNLLAMVDFAEWPESSTCPKGHCAAILGPSGNLEAEEDALLWNTSSVRWSHKWLTLGLQSPSFHGIPVQEGETFHIDPPGCKDIDDAITILPGESSVQVAIHIADVSSYLEKNMWMHRGKLLGQTIYKDGQPVVPLLPPMLSEDLCSLRPGAMRSTVTFQFEWSSKKKAILSKSWAKKMVCVKKTYTYDTAYTNPYATTMQEIAATLSNQPSCPDSHDWIEQFMLLYNKEAAQLLRLAQKGILRRHSQPDRERFEKFKALGLPAEVLASRAGTYCLATDSDVEHWGLQTGVYCHATSPIRRWADCVNQSFLQEILFHQGFHTDLLEQTQKTIDSLNALMKGGKAYERDLHFVRALIGPSAKKEVHGIVAETLEDGRVSLWIPEWKQLVRTAACQSRPEPGSEVLVHVFSDPSQRNWKKRLVLRLENIEQV
jgi:exoribonuclease R